MKKNIKHFKKWLALLLAVVLVGGICVVTRGGSLRATEGEPAEENAEETEVVSEPEEIILSDEGSDTTETTEAQPEEGTDAVVPEGGNGENVEGEEPVIKEETDSPDAEEVQSEKETPEEEKSLEELLPEEVEKVERSVKVVSSLEGVETVEEGTSITLTAELTGFDDVEYEIQWQRSTDGTDWEDVDGANDIEYTFDITEETDGYLWRVGVFTSEA